MDKNTMFSNGVKLADTAKAFAKKILPDSEVELTGEIPFEIIAPYEEPALKHLAEYIDLPGFRKGHVPLDMVRKKVGDIGVLEEAVELFIADFYPELIAAQSIDAVGRPAVNITKLAKDNPVGLTVRTAVYPEIELPSNFKEIHTTVPAEEAEPVTEEDVEKTLENLRQSRAVREEGKEPVVPELTDEFAKSLGAFENLEALKTQIKKGIGEEKERTAHDKRRGKIIDALLADTKVEIPKIFIESELEKIMSQLREDITRFGLKFEDYLVQVQKTEELLRADFREQAKKRAKLQLTLNKIAQEEKVEADQEAVAREVKHAFEHFPDAKPELVKIHVESVLRNEKVLKLLEGDKSFDSAEVK